MSIYEMTVDKMFCVKMSDDEMFVDKMSCCHQYKCKTVYLVGPELHKAELNSALSGLNRTKKCLRNLRLTLCSEAAASTNN